MLLGSYHGGNDGNEEENRVSAKIGAAVSHLQRALDRIHWKCRHPIVESTEPTGKNDFPRREVRNLDALGLGSFRLHVLI